MILNQVAQGGSPAISVVDTTDSGGGTVRTITASGTTIPTPASDISKLILNGVTQMDVTDTTATVSDVASGKVFTQVDGTTGTGTASSNPTVGTHNVELGQYTPTATGGFSFSTTVPNTATVLWACVWLDDASVLSNYSTANIMTASAIPISGNMRLINFFQSGTSKVDVKTAFGIRIGSGGGGVKSVTYDSHANWPGQPETYNYMVVYD